MQTLYDVLGLSRHASTEQIEQAYKLHVNSIIDASNNATIEQNRIKAMAIKEAHSILTSPARRANYDARLAPKQAVSYQVVESSPFPWIKAAIAFLVLFGGFLLYNQQQHKAEVERLAIEAKQAQAEADRAEQTAIAEEARAQQARLDAQRRAESQQTYQTERARQEGQSITQRNIRFDDQLARDKKRDEQQAAADKVRADREALQRNDAQTAALRRALAIPISRH